MCECECERRFIEARMNPSVVPFLERGSPRLLFVVGSKQSWTYFDPVCQSFVIDSVFGIVQNGFVTEN